MAAIPHTTNRAGICASPARVRRHTRSGLCSVLAAPSPPPKPAMVISSALPRAVIPTADNSQFQRDTARASTDSAIPDCSSLASLTIADTTYAVIAMASTWLKVAKMLSRPCAWNARANSGLVSIESRRLLAIDPNAIPARTIPAAHPVSSPRCSCRLSPNAEVISGALAFSPREGNTPASYWRRPSSTCAVSISARVVPTRRGKGHQRRSTNGRIC